MSTSSQGNDFRDKVASLLRAAGFSDVKTETSLHYKNVDIFSVWKRQSLDGELSYVIETKNYTGLVPFDECSVFASQYGEIVRKGLADRAWLISKGPVSPKGRDQIKSTMGKNLDCLTFEELQRRVFWVDGYLDDIGGQYLDSGLRRFYIPPHSDSGIDIEQYVFGWLDDNNDNSRPLAIMGGYGQGKTTFALHLAHQLIAKSKEDPTTRIPILIPLGEIQNEQSIEGLVGKILAYRHRIENYHYRTFSSLNENGRLVLLFDGFDEMRHGMTTATFAANIHEIMKLDTGKSKLIVLGRNTIFQNDREAREIIFGQEWTASGQETNPRRRSFRALELRDFTNEEAATYVRNYFPDKIGQVSRKFKQEVEPAALEAWLQQRMAEILDPKYRELIVRPVHAQMMCDIATNPSVRLDDISKYDLYDRFTHYLIKREMDKIGRFPGFGDVIRRRFNSAVAWWLWMQGAIATTSLFEIPMEFCVDATKGIRHDFSDEGLKRELLSGCLTEKRMGVVYFPHRSLQEFLVSDYIWNNVLGESPSERKKYDDKFLLACTSEITDFVAGRIRLEQRLGHDPSEKSFRLVSLMQSLQNKQFTKEQLKFFFAVAQAAGLSRRIEQDDAPWARVLAFFLKNDDVSFELKTAEAVDYLRSGLNAAPHRARLVAYYLWGTVILHGDSLDRAFVEEFLASLTPAEELSEVIDRLSSGYPTIPRTSERLWFFMRVFRITGNNLSLSIEKLLEVIRDSEPALGILDGLDRSAMASKEISISFDDMDRMLTPKASRRARRNLRLFLNDTKLQYRISTQD
jgi:hypothetical protein